MDQGYIPILMIFIVAVVGVYLMLKMENFLAPKKEYKNKYEVYECGEATIGDSKGPFKIQYYFIILVFVIFDVEMIFLIPWASYSRSFGWTGIFEVLLFLGMLVFVLFYAFKKRYMEWH